MAAPVTVTRTDGVTRVGFSIPEGTDAPTWWRQQVALYSSTPGPTVPAQVEAAWVSEVAAVVDRLVDPGIAPTVPPSVGRVLPARTFGPRGSIRRVGVEVDRWEVLGASRWPELRTAAAAGTLTAAQKVDFERIQMALAQVSILREVVTGARSRVVTIVERPGGEILTVLLVGSVIVAAVALDEYFDSVRTADALQAAADERTARARIAQAAQDYRTRLDVYRSSGTMPPASATETAVQADVARRANTEWDNFWQGAARAASGVGKAALAVAALLLLLGSSKR